MMRIKVMFGLMITVLLLIGCAQQQTCRPTTVEKRCVTCESPTECSMFCKNYCSDNGLDLEDYMGESRQYLIDENREVRSGEVVTASNLEDRYFCVCTCNLCD